MPSQLKERAMAWPTVTDVAITALIGPCADALSTGAANSAQAAPDHKDTAPAKQGATFRAGWPHRVIRRGDAVRPLPPYAHTFTDLAFEVGDRRLSLNDYMLRRRT